jgi:DNA-binding MarR family transcriptional regulator
MMIQQSVDERDQHRQQVYKIMKSVFHIDDMRGVELYTSLARVAQLGMLIDSQRFCELEVSPPRYQLLLRLFIAEKNGNTNGMTPTELSKYKQVSKNTVSSLLRGLEEQGYIQREMDPNDLRIFRIHLTEAGRQLIMDTAPERIKSINRLIDGLTVEEIEQFKYLLEKLRHHLEIQASQIQANAIDSCEAASN